MSAKNAVRAIYRGYAKSVARSWPVRWIDDSAAEIARWAYPTSFWYGRYPHTFLERRPPADRGGPSELPALIWAVWTGTNPLTPSREACLGRMRAMNRDTPIELVTTTNLAGLVRPGHPLHRSYENLSLVHRADYLRAYLLHHYGGGYSDIKQPRSPWAASFDTLRTSEKWALGSPVVPPAWPGEGPGRLGKHLRRYRRDLLSSGTLIAKSHTPFTAEWLREVERRLDYHAPALAESPGGIWGQEAAYPISWTGLLADVQHPLCLKYRDQLIIDSSIAWDTRAPYR